MGKLFSYTEILDSNTEMFIFLTPYVIHNSSEEMERLCLEEAKRRPGDNQEFFQRVAEAQFEKKKRLFEGGMKMLFGRKSS